MADATAWYDANADAAAARYEGIPPERLHGWLADLLPAGGRPPALLTRRGEQVRRAAWASSSGATRRGRGRALGPHAGDARERHAEPAAPVAGGLAAALRRTLEDRLGVRRDPASAPVDACRPVDRARAFRKLVNLLKPGGLIALSLRHGPGRGRPRHAPGVGRTRSARLASEPGRTGREWCVTDDDHLGRPDVRWTRVAVRLPGDGAGALPLLRHGILNDEAARGDRQTAKPVTRKTGPVIGPPHRSATRRRPWSTTRYRSWSFFFDVPRDQIAGRRGDSPVIRMRSDIEPSQPPRIRSGRTGAARMSAIGSPRRVMRTVWPVALTAPQDGEAGRPETRDPDCLHRFTNPRCP